MSEVEAIEIARTTAATREMRWHEGFISTYLDRKSGRECWIVEVSSPPPPGEPDWFGSFDDRFFYLVDIEEKRCIGVEGLPNFSMAFPR